MTGRPRFLSVKHISERIRPCVLPGVLPGALMVLLLFLLSGCSGASTLTDTSSSSTAPASADATATADFFAMNTYMSITANGTEAQAAVDAAQAEVYRLENQLSRTIAGSEISQINAQSGKGPVTVSKETFDMISKAVSYSEKTGGAFDITIAPIMDLWGFSDGNFRVPEQSEILTVLPLVDWQKISLDEASLSVELPAAGMALDLGGIAKGYASDKVQQIMSAYDITSALISLGGNVAVSGPKANGGLWKIAISDPNAADSYIGILAATDISVITSGGYERNFTKDGVTYIHIVDPALGSPVKSDLLSVSIITTDGVQGDCLSTSLFVLGKDKAIAYWKEHQDFECVLVTTAGEVFASPGIKDTFTLTDEKGTLTIFE